MLSLESITGGVAKDKEESQFITTSVQLVSSNMISTTECQNVLGISWYYLILHPYSPKCLSYILCLCPELVVRLVLSQEIK